MTTNSLREATVNSTATASGIERIHVDHASVKRLGHWTGAGFFHVRVRRGTTVLDLRSPRVAGDIDMELEVRRSTIVLLLPGDVAVDHWQLRFDGRGRVKDDQPPTTATRSVRLRGAAADSQIRIRRGGAAQLTAMFSREYLADLRRSRRAATFPTVDDPRRGAA